MGCYSYRGEVCYYCTLTPGIIAIAGNYSSSCIGYCYYVALQVLHEVEGCAVIYYSANAFLVVIKRNYFIITAAFIDNSFFKYLCTIKDIMMRSSVCSFIDSYAVSIILELCISKALKLSALLPYKSCSAWVCNLIILSLVFLVNCFDKRISLIIFKQYFSQAYTVKSETYFHF